MPAAGAVGPRPRRSPLSNAPAHLNVFLRVRRWIQTVFCSVPSDRAKSLDRFALGRGAGRRAARDAPRRARDSYERAKL